MISHRATNLAVFVFISLWLTCPLIAQTKKSLVIGVDGMGYGLNGFDVAATPVMDSLIDGTWQAQYQGAYSANAFAGGVLGTPTQQVTVSGPGWSTMLTGVWTDRHGVTGNGGSFTNGNFTDNPPYIGSIKSVDTNLVTASLVNWNPIDTNLLGAVDSDSDSQNNLNFRGTYSNDAQVTNAAVSTINSIDPDAVFVSFDEVDGAGHSSGSSSIGYRQQIETTDGYIGQILTAVSNRSNFENEDWQIIITADHGHKPSGGHGGQTELERTIPFIVASKTLGQGTLPNGVSHADVAPTVMDHFGFAIPSHYWGKSRAAGSFLAPDVVAFDDFEGLDLVPFTVAVAPGETDWTNMIRTGTAREWTIDNSGMSGMTTELAYLGWTAMDIDSWIAEQGNQIGRDAIGGAGSNNTVLVADPDAWDDYTTGASNNGYNSFIQRSYDLTGFDETTVSITMDYMFYSEVNQLGEIEVSFDSGASWITLATFDSSTVPNNTLFQGVAGTDFFNVSGTSSTMLLKFGCSVANNNWFFAVDNITVATGDGFSDTEDFEGLTLQPFTTSTSGDEGTDFTKDVTNWIIDDSNNLGYSEEMAYDGWSAIDVDSWTQEQGGQGRSVFGAVYPNNTALVADGDAFYDYDFDFNDIDPAPPNAVNSYVSRTYDLSGHDNCTLQIEFMYEFRIENDQLGVAEISFDGGTTWTRLLELDNNDGSIDDTLSGLVTYEALTDFTPSQTNTMILRFGYLNADNHWWMAIDDVLMRADPIDYVKGDANNDGVTDNLDLSAFVLAILNRTMYEMTYGLDPDVVFDFDCSGGFNNLDIAGFIKVFQGN